MFLLSLELIYFLRLELTTNCGYIDSCFLQFLILSDTRMKFFPVPCKNVSTILQFQNKCICNLFQTEKKFFRNAYTFFLIIFSRFTRNLLQIHKNLTILNLSVIPLLLKKLAQRFMKITGISHDISQFILNRYQILFKIYMQFFTENRYIKF